jgi:hypothetical protein
VPLSLFPRPWASPQKNRGSLSDDRAVSNVRLASLAQEIVDAEAKLKALGTTKPVAAIEAATAVEAVNLETRLASLRSDARRLEEQGAGVTLPDRGNRRRNEPWAIELAREN